MRFAWTVAGDDPDYTSMQRHGVNGLFAPLWDSLTTREYLRLFQSKGFIAGLYLGHNWFPGESAVEQARRVSAEYRLLTNAKPGEAAIKNVRVCLNWEQHDAEDIALGLEEWRRLQPKTETSWSMEGMQGGWMTDLFVARVMACRVRWVPQAFWGDMSPIAADQVLRDLTRRGVPENIVSLFYDGAALPDRWDGYAFTAGRIPL